MDKQERPSPDDLFGRAIFDTVVNWISRHLEPEHVFPVDTLADWARDNGFVSVDVPETGPGRDC